MDEKEVKQILADNFATYFSYYHNYTANWLSIFPLIQMIGLSTVDDDCMALRYGLLRRISTKEVNEQYVYEDDLLFDNYMYNNCVIPNVSVVIGDTNSVNVQDAYVYITLLPNDYQLFNDYCYLLSEKPWVNDNCLDAKNQFRVLVIKSEYIKEFSEKLSAVNRRYVSNLPKNLYVCTSDMCASMSVNHFLLYTIFSSYANCSGRYNQNNGLLLDLVKSEVEQKTAYSLTADYMQSNRYYHSNFNVLVNNELTYYVYVNLAMTNVQYQCQVVLNDNCHIIFISPECKAIIDAYANVFIKSSGRQDLTASDVFLLADKQLVYSPLTALTNTKRKMDIEKQVIINPALNIQKLEDEFAALSLIYKL